MPLYYFTITNGDKRFRAEEPLDLVDDAAAWDEATKTAGQIIGDLGGSFMLNAEWSIVVENAAGEPLRTLTVTAT